MKFIQIKSKGEIAVEALSLIGASTKRDDSSKIGMFGSGLKYAVASLIRQGYVFAVFSGKNEIRINTREVEFKGKTFNKIYIDGKETSLTDSMGTEDWKGVFPFIREIYSNALDEDAEATIKITNEIEIEDGYTVFFIEAKDELIDFMQNMDDYFTNQKNVLFKCSKGEILRSKHKTTIFRRGILSYSDDALKSIFSYNLEDVEINESRVIKNIYAAKNEIGFLIESCTDPYVLRKWINSLKDSNTGFFEHDCILTYWYGKVNNPVLVDVILENEYYPVEIFAMLDEEDTKNRIGLPIKLLRRFLEYVPDLKILGFNYKGGDSDSMFIERECPVELFDKVHEAVTILKNTNYVHKLTSPIKYCKFQDSSTLGCASDKTIMLSIKLVDYSVDEIAKIIIEEQEHIHTDYPDESRRFQNHFINLYYNELRKHGKQ